MATNRATCICSKESPKEFVNVQHDASAQIKLTHPSGFQTGQIGEPVVVIAQVPARLAVCVPRRVGRAELVSNGEVPAEVTGNLPIIQRDGEWRGSDAHTHGDGGGS